MIRDALGGVGHLLAEVIDGQHVYDADEVDLAPLRTSLSLFLFFFLLLFLLLLVLVLVLVTLLCLALGFD